MEVIDHGVLREIGNGVWTMLGAFVIAALAYTLVQDMRDWTHQESWRVNRGTALAAGAFVYFTGSIIRSAYIWLGLIADNRQMDEAILAQWRFMLLIAVAAAIIGGLCIVRVCIADRFGSWSWITAGVVSVAVPVAVYWWV